MRRPSPRVRAVPLSLPSPQTSWGEAEISAGGQDELSPAERGKVANAVSRKGGKAILNGQIQVVINIFANPVKITGKVVIGIPQNGITQRSQKVVSPFIVNDGIFFVMLRAI